MPPARPCMALFWPFVPIPVTEAESEPTSIFNSNRNRDLILGTLRIPRDHDGVPAVTSFAEDRSDPVEGLGGKATEPD